MTVADLDAREAEVARLVVLLRRQPGPSTQQAAELLAGLWSELRGWLEDGVQMSLFDEERV